MTNKLALIAIVAAVALTACSSSSSSSDSTSTSSAATSDNSAANTAASPDSGTTDAIQKLTAAEDSGFSDVTGAKKGENADNVISESTLTIPNYVCIVIAAKNGSSKLVTCDTKSSTQTDSDAAFATAKQGVAAAMPSLTSKDVNTKSGKFIGQWLFSDDKHAVFIYEKQVAPGNYRTSISFAVPSYFNS